MSNFVDRADPRYGTLKGSRNLRWPRDPQDTASEIALCATAQDAAAALERLVHEGVRPTIRSGGHCYEDFVVNNRNGCILDMSVMKAPEPRAGKGSYAVAPGQMLGEVYEELYKRYNKTLPAGSCYAVGAGGHISGGGYGLLSRLHGLTCDWISAVDILTVDGKGKVALRHTDKSHDADLFRACRGAGGGSFGVITGFYFDELPDAPQEVAEAHVGFEWDKTDEDTFVEILQTFGGYWETRGQDPDTWGLFSIMNMSHASGGHFGFGSQFCNPNGRADDLKVFEEFLGRFEKFTRAEAKIRVNADRQMVQPQPATPPNTDGHGSFDIQKRQWLEATISGSGGGGSGRASYKSSYMKKNFSDQEARCIYRHFTRKVEGIDPRGMVLAVDSYGGAANKRGTAEETSICQRDSVMKLQWENYWRDADQDAARLQLAKEFYADLYSIHVDAAHKGTPYHNERYQGCYINYPDSDMLAYSFWPQLYWGEGELYPFLQDVKRRYDPNNVFHHAMSVRV
ncbi:FAD-dependent oxidoreductase [Silvibacterium acidisoli]|uniref:FAD-dependent oxidoreductase n=1 Tax=Acidobacteriaceae bacterium ZG23-2 TaxID=2883246 RepID=UPI00406C8723